MKHQPSKKSDVYEVKEGKVERKRKFCPKCGPGVFMARHDGRLHCGRCGYTEFVKPEKEPEKQEKKESGGKQEKKPGEKPKGKSGAKKEQD